MIWKFISVNYEHNKNENKENDEKIDLNKDFLLIESTKIVNDYINMNKKRIFVRLDDFINLLNEFHDTKYFSLQDSKSGGISVIKDDTSIPISQLSSGEKQLIILLTEALLQKFSEMQSWTSQGSMHLHAHWSIPAVCRFQHF